MTRQLFQGLLGICVLSSQLSDHVGADDPPPSAKWEAAIQAYEKQDGESPPKQGGVLFVGSSSIRLWDLERSFPDLHPLNRGFGGSEVADSVHFADRIVLPYAPRIIVMYAGDNDIAGGKEPCTVHADFQKFVEVVHTRLPETRIVYLGIKPSVKRWHLIHKIRAANALIAAMCLENERLTFIDVDAPMLGGDGRPRPELFVEDGLHLSDAGYQLWSDLLRPHLQ